MLLPLSLGLAVIATQTGADAPASSHPDPARCRVVLEDMGNVGLRISDAQALAQDALSALRRRLGQDAAVYEGLLKSHEQLRRVLGPGAETQVQDEQVAYLEACARAAPFRVQIRFGKSRKKGGHFITVACRNAGSKRHLDQKRFEAKTFKTARDDMNEAIEGFCPLLASKASAPAPTQKPPKRRWSLPPRRD